MSDYSIVLDEQLDITQVLAQQELLKSALNEGDDFIIDGSAVTRTDTAGLQLLLAFIRQVESQGRKVRWLNHSEPLLQGAELLGLKRALALD